MRSIIIVFFTAISMHACAQSSWNMQQCMQYAVEHNHDVKCAELDLDNYKASRTGAIGSFLPEVDASTGIQYNFGRAINPNTNIYTDVNTFSNGYSVNTSLSVFDGFNRLYALKAAKAGVLMGRHALRLQQDQAALNVLTAFTNVAYYERMVEMAAEKLEETTLLLKQTRLMEEVGRKSLTDVALVESQQAEANYELTRQQNLYASALLELKKEMAFPIDDSLAIEVGVGNACLVEIPHQGYSQEHSDLQKTHYQMLSSKHEWYRARASLYPSISMNAGISTNYNKDLHDKDALSFNRMFKSNLGEYVSASLTIPLFNRLQTLTNIRKAKNNYIKARETYEQKQLELEKLSREAWQDWLAYQKQTRQMEKKVEADSLSYQLMRRKYEEGLSNPIEVHTTSVQLLNSKATLVQCQLMAMVKEQLVRYYKGETIWTE